MASPLSNHPNAILREYHASREQQRKLVVLAGGSCLTCKHTKVAVGKRLLCKLKQDKLVSQYNYCDKWCSLLEEKGK